MMLWVCVTALLLSLVTCAPRMSQQPSSADDDNTLYFQSSDASNDEQWLNFKDKFGKTYEGDEEMIRKDIFIAHLKTIDMHNYLYDQGKSTFNMAVNQFTDMSTKEFESVMQGFRAPNDTVDIDAATYLSPSTKVDLPDSVDWRTMGYVTPVKSQGSCGSCWAFSTTGTLEGQHRRKTGTLVSLSEQNLVDCVSGNWGCSGGYMTTCFKYINVNHGIDSEASYPYEHVKGSCRYSSANMAATVTGYVEIPKGSEAKLQEAVATVGPVAVAFDAGGYAFQHYSSGVYDNPSCTTRLTHAVLAVGYGTEGGKDYWLVKNSWATSWGDRGYVKMSRNKSNQCGITNMASYPTV